MKYERKTAGNRAGGRAGVLSGTRAASEWKADEFSRVPPPKGRSSGFAKTERVSRRLGSCAAPIYRTSAAAEGKRKPESPRRKNGNRCGSAEKRIFRPRGTCGGIRSASFGAESFRGELSREQGSRE